MRTIPGIIHDKIADAVEAATFDDLKGWVTKFGVSATISTFFVNGGPELIINALKWHDFAPLRVFGVFMVVYSSKHWLPLLSDHFSHESDMVEESDDLLVEGVSIRELTDYIMEKKSFPVIDAKKDLALSKQSVQNISEGLEEVGVFIRGANNSRVLSEEFARSDIVNILGKYSSSGEWHRVFRQEDENTFTHSPRYEIQE